MSAECSPLNKSSAALYKAPAEPSNQPFDPKKHQFEPPMTQEFSSDLEKDAMLTVHNEVVSHLWPAITLFAHCSPLFCAIILLLVVLVLSMRFEKRHALHSAKRLPGPWGIPFLGSPQLFTSIPMRILIFFSSSLCIQFVFYLQIFFERVRLS